MEDRSELIAYAEKLYNPSSAKAYVKDCLSEGMTASDIKECIDDHIELYKEEMSE